MKTEDFQREPCTCEACTVAGVSKLPQRRDPQSGAWLHGRELRRYYEAKQKFLTAFKNHEPKGMR